MSEGSELRVSVIGGHDWLENHGPQVTLLAAGRSPEEIRLSPESLRLLVFLAVHPGEHRPAALKRALWPEPSVGNGRSQLLKEREKQFDYCRAQLIKKSREPQLDWSAHLLVETAKGHEKLGLEARCDLVDLLEAHVKGNLDAVRAIIAEADTSRGGSDTLAAEVPSDWSTDCARGLLARSSDETFQARFAAAREAEVFAAAREAEVFAAAREADVESSARPRRVYRQLLLFGAVLLAAIVFVVAIVVIGTRSPPAMSMSPTRFGAIRIGMTKAQIFDLLGQPNERTAVDDDNKPDTLRSGVPPFFERWTYSRPRRTLFFCEATGLASSLLTSIGAPYGTSTDLKRRYDPALSDLFSGEYYDYFRIVPAGSTAFQSDERWRHAAGQCDPQRSVPPLLQFVTKHPERQSATLVIGFPDQPKLP